MRYPANTTRIGLCKVPSAPKKTSVHPALLKLESNTLPKPARRSKYNAVKTEVDGITFDSKLEASKYLELKARQERGEIGGLVADKKYLRFVLAVNGQKIADYVADFRYFDTETGTMTIADAKGIRTPVFSMKAKLMKALHDITILELTAKPRAKKRRIIR